MPTTTYTDATMGARAIGARTDSGASPVTDISAEEDRYSAVAFSEGRLEGVDSYEPVAGSAATMNVIIGSGAAKADYYIVPGTTAGQGQYVIRLASATETVTLDAADGSNPRVDEIYLVVQDDAYDSSGNALPRFGYRKGDAGASPSAPGPDSGWDASALIATIDVPTAAADILACTITDERLLSTFTVPAMTLDGGDLAMGAGDIITTGLVDGLDLNLHDHDGTSVGGAVVDANDLTDIKAAVDAAGVDADTLDGIDSTGFTVIAHDGAGGAAHADVVAAGADGFMTGADKTRLDAMETGATQDQTAAQHLADLLTVDGTGSGLDADLLDGIQLVAMAPEIMAFGVGLSTGTVALGTGFTDHHSVTYTKPSGWTTYTLMVIATPNYDGGVSGNDVTAHLDVGGTDTADHVGAVDVSNTNLTLGMGLVKTGNGGNVVCKMQSKRSGSQTDAKSTSYSFIAIRTA